MKDIFYKIGYFVFLINSSLLFSQEAFQIIVLGCSGGPYENDLSSYLIAPIHSNDFIAFDAGSLLSGIDRAHKQESFKGISEKTTQEWNVAPYILREHVKAYCISHAHLDHVLGLVINSPEDSPKSIFAINSVIDFLKDHLFNWKIWPNFGSEGAPPQMNLYQYQRLECEKKIPIPNTQMNMQPFLLSHSRDYESTAFLVESNGSYAIYFGDTAPDVLEPRKHMENVWRKISPLARNGSLRGIFLECSYVDKEDHQLFGHLDVKHMMRELRYFASIVDPKSPEKALKGLKVIIVHIKGDLLQKTNSKDLIYSELERQNDLGIDFIVPSQGDRIEI